MIFGKSTESQYSMHERLRQGQHAANVAGEDMQCKFVLSFRLATKSLEFSHWEKSIYLKLSGLQRTGTCNTVDRHDGLKGMFCKCVMKMKRRTGGG